VHKIGHEVHPEKERYPDRDEHKEKRHRLFLMLSLFLKDDIVFSDRELFLQDTINFVPTEYHPRAENQEEKPDQKAENSWVKKDSDTQNQTNCSKENHRISLYLFSPRYKKKSPISGG
jgi:hypothetical protein